MNILCRWYQTKLMAYASAALPEKLVGQIEAHLRNCPTCQRELEASLRLVDALRVAAPVVASPNPYLWERLDAAIQAERPLPQPTLLRRLAPLGGMALAGTALAAVVVVRPSSLSPRVVPAPSVVVQLDSPVKKTVPTVQVAVAHPPAAVVAARKIEKLEPVGEGRDPFTTAEPSHPAVRSSLPAVVRHQPKYRQFRKTLPTLTSGQAVDLVEVGTQHVVEVVHTEALNRMVTETQRDDIMDKSRRAVCTPSDATTIAQNTRSLFQ